MAHKILMQLRWLVVSLALFTSTAFAAGEGRQVAITIDDLPRGGDAGPYDLAGVRAMTTKLLRPFREQRIPVIGFVNAGRAKFDPQGLQEILDLWLDAGAELGNHSYSHADINSVPLDVYTTDIVRGETMIRQALAPRTRTLEFYRHPYLHTGPTPEIKKGLQNFLDQRGYRVAPVTLDNSDYAFAVAYLQHELRSRVRREHVPYMESIVEFFEQRSVLLIHANEMNADLMPELLSMFRRRGYRFVTLTVALADPAYRAPEDYAGRAGLSWIYRWSSTKGMAPKNEPDPAEWVMKAFEAGRRAGAQPPSH
ncbi:polysaccharide deacetylase family protein [Povalibacter sp.]|uniref:polysaccharide deacetylase family protein n=1 Tax=Povalibacter sp. TaxID=1962978 RepID=UPI002F3F0257